MNAISNDDKIKILLGFNKEKEINSEQDFFELGMLKMHGLIDENMKLTAEGEQKFEQKFGGKSSKEKE